MKPTIEQIRQAAERFADEYEVVGIRTQEQPFELGEIDHVSAVWCDGEETDEELDGICATNVNSKRIDMHSDTPDVFHGFYYGDYTALVAGNSYSIGADEGEIIIRDAEVVYIF